MKVSMNTYLSSLTTNLNNIHTLHDLIAFTKKHPSEEFSHRNVAVLKAAEHSFTIGPLYTDMLEKEEFFFIGEGDIEAALSKHNWDVLIVPTLYPILQMLAAKAGSPVVCVPMGVYPPGTRVKRDKEIGMVNVALGVLYVFTLACGHDREW